VKKFLLIILLLGIFVSCEHTYVPKPRGYFRIDLPEKAYQKFDTNFPYTFEYPVYAKVVPDTLKDAEPYWINIEFPGFGGEINVSYKTVNHNLVKFLEDSRTMVMKHIPKAEEIRDSLIMRPEANVYGLLYDIEGTGAASPCQFILTDSTRHFLRAALYFNVRPNNDSLAPVISFIRKDIDHMISTFRWKDQ
jgi:gliding motility-associated lipoprotein GldD